MRQVAVGDIDSDGESDIVSANVGTSPSAFAAGTLLALGASNPDAVTVADVLQTLTCPGTTKVIVADINSDGRNDLLCPRPASATVRAFLSF